MSLSLIFLRNFFFVAAAAVAILIPIDVLAVYLIPSSVSDKIFKKSDGLESAQTVHEPASVYRDALAASRLFGVVTAPPNAVLTNTAEIANLALKGIVILGTKDAILQEKDTKRTVFLKEGDHIRNYLVKEIREDSIILSDGKGETEMKIEENFK